MSCLSWNCCGLGHPRTFQVLVDLARTKKPDIFLMETLCHRDKLKCIKIKLGYAGLFDVEKVGRSDGLAFFWKPNYSVNLLKFGRSFIDLVVENTEGGKWRFIGFYGFPESNR
ncbi:hypothetical protein AB3S75_042249 [Citrus x aurantiifolia]